MGFWTQPLGKTLAERKGETYYEPSMCGTAKTGMVYLKSDGRMSAQSAKSFKSQKWHADDIASIRIEDGVALSQRATVGRTGGGAIAGGLLFGPIGLLAGGVIGAAAKKTEGGEKFLTIDLTDGRVIFVEVPSKEYAKARQMIHTLEQAKSEATSD